MASPFMVAVCVAGFGVDVVLVLGWYGLKGVVVLGQTMLLNLALVVGQVEVIKHLLSATLAPRSVKYCLDRFMPVTVVAACFILLAYRNRSSAKILGSTLCALMQESQGFISRATRAMEKGQPCGMEHLCWCG